MSLSDLIDAKTSEARSVIEVCIGNSGVWGSSDLETVECSGNHNWIKRQVEPYLLRYGITPSGHESTENFPGYQGLCWSRDFANGGIDGLDAIDHEDFVLVNLDNIELGDDGSVPTFFVDEGFPWQEDKNRLLWEDLRRRTLPYAWKGVERIFGKFSPQRYTPRTTDTALHYINGILTYAQQPGKNEIKDRYRGNIERALAFVETNVRDGLYRGGGDARDNLRFPRGVALLSNNCLLFNIYTLLGLHDKATELKATIQAKFWKGTYHADHPDTERLDVFGQAIAVLYGIADPETQYEGIAAKFRKMETEFGFTANDYGPSDVSWWVRRKNIRINQLSPISPCATGYMILALDRIGEHEIPRDRMGAHELARKAHRKWINLEGHREWYDAVTGEGKGAINYMSSAGMYLRVTKELGLIKGM